MFSNRKFTACLALILLLAGCAPRLIASSPLNIASAPRPLPTLMYTSARLSVEVDDVPSAASQAIDLAQRYGGWVIDRACRGTGRNQIINLVLSVPASNRERLRRALTGLGRVYDQAAWNDASGCSNCSDAAYIYLELSPSNWVWGEQPPTPPGDSRGPAETFRRAWQVTAAIFTFLLDVLIWIAVVAGPFVLIGLGILALVRRARR
jgi:hypothetical protein